MMMYSSSSHLLFKIFIIASSSRICLNTTTADNITTTKNVKVQESSRQFSPLPPFHFWPRFQPQFFTNTYKLPNPKFYHVQNDPEQAKVIKQVSHSQPHLFDWINRKSHVKFRLWTRKNPILAQQLIYNAPSSIESSHFNHNLATKIIIHGFADGASEVYIGQWLLDMKQAYLNLADLNIIVVDYSIHSRFPFYVNANPELVGTRLGEMIQFLVQQSANKNKLVTIPTLYNSYHLIGWSWGSHVAGFAGKYLNGSLGRISGLDPAGPTFRYVSNEFRLDGSDAGFVDIIHTNSKMGVGSVWGGQLGLDEALGHVDVYVNGGGKQTGCPLERTLVYESKPTYDYEWFWTYLGHGRAPQYWTESIQSPLAFPICFCPSFDEYVAGNCSCDVTLNELNYMGEHLPTAVNRTKRGIYQIITRSHTLYGHGPQMSIKTIPPAESSTNDLNRNVVKRNSQNSNNDTNTSTVTQKSNHGDDDNNLMTALIQYENHTYTIPISSKLFYVQNYPSNDILDMCLALIKDD